MIPYDPGHWGVACIFKLRGSVFPKAMVWAVPCSAIAGLLHFLLQTNDDLRKSIGIGDAATSIFGGFTFILGFLLVFRFQQAYNRWWDGASLLMQLRGEWFNAYSCLIAFSNAAAEKQESVYAFQQQLVRLFSLLYGCALTQVSQMETNDFELINLDGLDATSLKFLQECPDKCEITLQWIQRLIVESEASCILKIAPPILSRVYNELGNGIVNLSNARKIKEYPIPFPLAQMVMVMLMFHAIMTPLICAATVQSTMWAAMLSFVVTFSYWSILYIALELEMPFGDDPNDLPMREMAERMNESLCQVLNPLAMTVPYFDVNAMHSELRSHTVDLDADLSEVGVSSGWLESAPRKSLLQKLKDKVPKLQVKSKHQRDLCEQESAQLLRENGLRSKQESDVIVSLSPPSLAMEPAQPQGRPPDEKTRSDFQMEPLTLPGTPEARLRSGGTSSPPPGRPQTPNEPSIEELLEGIGREEAPTTTFLCGSSPVDRAGSQSISSRSGSHPNI